MAAIPSQDLAVVDDNKRRQSYSLRDQRQMSELSFENDTDTQLIDVTIECVKEKVWSFRAALKAAAEVLVHYGLSPAAVGYSSVPVGDDEKLAEKDEAEAALQKVKDDEILARSAYPGRPEESRHEYGTEEESRLTYREEDDDDDSNHAFVHSVRKEKDERKALTITWPGDDA